jgi:hypothetical protein
LTHPGIIESISRMPSFRVRAVIAAVLLSAAASAQKPQPTAPPPQLSPKAAYDDAMHPLEVTRHSIANWSDTEVQALTVAIANAATECAARDPKTFAGDALIDLARLCALGQSWPAVVQTTALYISSDAPSKPRLNQAYEAQIDAQLHLKDEHSALTGAQAMLGAVPYDALVAETIDEAIGYMQLVHTTDAITLDAARQPLLLATLRAPRTPADPTQPSPAFPPQSIHELYAAGISYAALQQLANQPDAAQSTLAALDAAVPTNLIPDDAIPIAAARKRYAFLGQPLPAIHLLNSLSMPNRLPELPAHSAMTALLLFPDWCAQCVRLGPQLPQSVFLVEGREAYVYVLLAETSTPKPKALPAKDAPPEKPAPRDLLAETPTVVVPPSVLTQFAADDFPFLIIADAHGVIRLLQPVSEDVLQSGGTLDSAVGLIGQNWPLRPGAPASDPQGAAGPKATTSPQP